jgi:hypothetical protein
LERREAGVIIHGTHFYNPATCTEYTIKVSRKMNIPDFFFHHLLLGSATKQTQAPAPERDEMLEGRRERRRKTLCH